MNYHGEVAVLSTVLNELELGFFGHVSRVAGNKGENLFFDPRNRAVFTAISQVYQSDGAPTPALVTDMLYSQEGLFDDNPEAYINMIQLTPIIPTIEQLNTTLEELDDARTIRRQSRELQQIIEDIKDPDVVARPEDIVTRIQEVADGTQIKSDTQTFAEILEEIEASSAPMWTVSTGLPSIDRVLGGDGLESGCFTLVAARAKVGKTIFMNNLVVNILKNGGVPIVLNLETKQVEFMAKIMSRYIANPELPWGQIKKYLSKDVEVEESMSRTHKEQIKDAKEWASEQDWYAEFNKSTTMQDIYALVQKTKAENDKDAKIVLLVDYIQLQVTNSRYEREEITQLSRFYKKLAGEMEISVFSLAQLNRNSAEGVPVVSDLRGSGSLEQDADSIILLYHPEKEEGMESEHDHNEIMVKADTTRLAAGEEFRLFKDAANQLIAEISPERASELDRQASDYTEFVEQGFAQKI